MSGMSHGDMAVFAFGTEAERADGMVDHITIVSVLRVFIDYSTE